MAKLIDVTALQRFWQRVKDYIDSQQSTDEYATEEYVREYVDTELGVIENGTY